VAVDGPELGRRLRIRRTAAGRTIASVALDAGLSVPYIANLENGRGNPTLGALQRLARALGTRLDVSLVAPDGPGGVDQPAGSSGPGDDAQLPESLVHFARTARFQREAERLAQAAGVDPLTLRERLLSALVATAAVTAHPLDELDWHRVLDAIVLIGRFRD
jgi:transcriptional regulator with XRE-family HTH domain